LTPDELLGQINQPQSGMVRLAAGSGDFGTTPVDELGLFVVPRRRSG
jgi:hypothetical protein